MERRVIEDFASPHVFQPVGVSPEYLGCPPRKRRVDVDRHARQPPRVEEAGNIEKQLLRALECEYRNDQIAA